MCNLAIHSHSLISFSTRYVSFLVDPKLSGAALSSVPAADPGTRSQSKTPQQKKTQSTEKTQGPQPSFRCYLCLSTIINFVTIKAPADSRHASFLATLKGTLPCNVSLSSYQLFLDIFLYKKILLSSAWPVMQVL